MSDYIKREDALKAIRDVMEQAKHLRPPIYDAIDNVKAILSVDVIEIGKPYKRDKNHVLYFEITQDDYGDEWWTIRRQDNGSKNSK